MQERSNHSPLANDVAVLIVIEGIFLSLAVPTVLAQTGYEAFIACVSLPPLAGALVWIVRRLRSRNDSRFAIILWRALCAGLAAIVVIAGAAGWIFALSEQRHSDALARLAADGASIGSPRYGSGLTVYLSGPRFTDAHLEYLKDLKRVRELLIDDAPQITDAGFALLGRQRDIETLFVSRTGVSAESLKQIGGWPAVNWLGVPGTGACGSDLHHLQRLKNLKILYLDENPITDADLPALDKLASLAWISLKKTRLTDAGVAKLKKRLASARVVR